jgi:hypothetical protein
MTDTIAICITVCFAGIVFLIFMGKLKGLSLSKAGGLSIQSTEASNEVLLHVLDHLLDQAQKNFNYTMVDAILKCSSEPEMQKRMCYISFVDNILREIQTIGLNRYLEIAGLYNGTLDCYSKHLLLALEMLVQERLDSYEKMSAVPSTDTFKAILQSKIEKNKGYRDLIQSYIDDLGLHSDTLTHVQKV